MRLTLATSALLLCLSPLIPFLSIPQPAGAALRDAELAPSSTHPPEQQSLRRSVKRIAKGGDGGGGGKAGSSGGKSGSSLKTGSLRQVPEESFRHVSKTNISPNSIVTREELLASAPELLEHMEAEHTTSAAREFHIRRALDPLQVLCPFYSL
jgi:hypothetical protein